MRECRPDDIGISVSYPLPGTRFYERVRSELGAKRNWLDSDDLDLMYEGPFPARFYRHLHRVVHKEFRLQRLRRRRPLSPRLWAARLYHALTLPWEEGRLRGLAVSPQGGPQGLAPVLTREIAARPTEQSG